jgi:hypothetical protein
MKTRKRQTTPPQTVPLEKLHRFGAIAILCGVTSELIPPVCRPCANLQSRARMPLGRCHCRSMHCHGSGTDRPPTRRMRVLSNPTLIRPITNISHERRVCAALQRELLARAAVGTMRGGPTYVERANEGTGCLPAKLERAIGCMRLIAGRTARPPLGISVTCERCLHRWLLSCSVAALWWGIEAPWARLVARQFNHRWVAAAT